LISHKKLYSEWSGEKSCQDP